MYEDCSVIAHQEEQPPRPETFRLATRRPIWWGTKTSPLVRHAPEIRHIVISLFLVL